MIARYSGAKMSHIWSDENRYQKYLEVEILAAKAQAKLGVIPQEAADEIGRRAKFSVARVAELEKETRHDVVAFTRCVAESLGPQSRYFHYGLTSYDVVDTALSVLLGEAAALLLEKLNELLVVLKEQALRYKNLPCVGRTHGMHAEPTSFGLKFALYYDETRRNIKRLNAAAAAVKVGKLSGAVGNFAHLDPYVEEYVCKKLGLEPAPVSTQVLQRDRHAAFVTVLAITGGTLEKMALEVRHLQRTEVKEAEEPFYEGQKGSSAMPHKRNPVTCEKICGLARLLRGYAATALENMALWHERDISHSSVERIILPDATIALDHMLTEMIRVTGGLIVYPKQLAKNLELTGGLIYSQRVLLALIEAGMLRETAYDLVQRCAMQAFNEGQSFEELLGREAAVSKRLGAGGLKNCFDAAFYLRRTDYIYKRLGL